jgi:hypothetical protein
MERTPKNSSAKDIWGLNANVKEPEKSVLHQELGRQPWPVAYSLLIRNLSQTQSSTAGEDKQVPVLRVSFNKA